MQEKQQKPTIWIENIAPTASVIHRINSFSIALLGKPLLEAIFFLQLIMLVFNTAYNLSLYTRWDITWSFRSYLRVRPQEPHWAPLMSPLVLIHRAYTSTPAPVLQQKLITNKHALSATLIQPNNYHSQQGPAIIPKNTAIMLPHHTSILGSCCSQEHATAFSLGPQAAYLKCTHTA